MASAGIVLAVDSLEGGGDKGELGLSGVAPRLTDGHILWQTPEHRVVVAVGVGSGLPLRFHPSVLALARSPEYACGSGHML